MDNYTLAGNTYSLDDDDNNVLENNPPSSKDDWSHTQYSNYKQKLKSHYYRLQFDRCAYCRKIVEADAYYEPLDHIVPKDLKHNWLFHCQNLIVTCDRCNNRKGTETPLAAGLIDRDDYPQNSGDFIIFTPHFDTWSDHFVFEHDIFISPVPGSKGAETIRVCKLDLKHVIINRSKELKLRQMNPIKRITHRLRELDKDSNTAQHIKDQLFEAIDFFADRGLDNENFD